MTLDYQHLPHAGIQSLHPYIPGKAAEEVAREQGLSQIIKLASNENPWGCSENAYEALLTFTPPQYPIYPSPRNHPLHQRLSARLSIEENRLILGNGSDALFALILTAFALHRDKPVLIHDYAFMAFRVSAQVLGVPMIAVPLKTDWRIDIEAMITTCHKTQPALLFLANPNNPVGVMLSRDELEQLLTEVPLTTLVLLDEAYFPYDKPELQHPGENISFSLKDNLDLLEKHPNLIITRTFSKAYGLAAFRLGYAVAAPELIAPLLKIQLPFSVTQAALIAGNAVLDDDAFIAHAVRMNAQEKIRVQEALRSLGLIDLPSYGNFITFDCGRDAQAIYQALLVHGIIVRPLHPYGLPNHLRVTIGTPEQNAIFIDKLNLCFEEKERAPL